MMKEEGSYVGQRNSLESFAGGYQNWEDSFWVPPLSIQYVCAAFEYCNVSFPKTIEAEGRHCDNCTKKFTEKEV